MHTCYNDINAQLLMLTTEEEYMVYFTKMRSKANELDFRTSKNSRRGNFACTLFDFDTTQATLFFFSNHYPKEQGFETDWSKVGNSAS